MADASATAVTPPTGERRRRREGASSWTPPTGMSEEQRGERDKMLFAFFIAMILGVTLLQKIGVTMGANTYAPLVLPLTLASMAGLTLFVKPHFDPMRLGLYALWVLFATVSVALQPRSFSITSLALLLVLYLPMLISFPTSEANYRRCMSFYSNLMLIATGLTLFQHLLQLLWSYRAWPSLDSFIPSSLLIPGFVYIQPIEDGSRFMKPNAIFFLEVSFLSQYLTLAIAIELLLFRRLWRLVLFIGTLFSTFAGTGVLLLALTVPVLLRRLSLRNGGLIIVGLVVVLVVAAGTGWLDTVSGRFDEYQRSGSSANIRFVEPLLRIIDFSDRPDAIYSGIGAGQMESLGFQWWPITKAIVEYGYLTGVAFYAFFLYVMLRRSPMREFAFTLIVWYSIEGSLLTAVNPLTCVLLSSMFLVEADSKARRRRRRSSAQGEDGAPRPADGNGMTAALNPA